MARASWKTWLDAVLGFFYPDICQICEGEQAGAGEGYVCSKCRREPGGVRYVEPPYCRKCGLPFDGAITSEFECANCREMGLSFAWARAAVTAGPLVLDVVHRYKYHRALWFEPFLAELLVRQAAKGLRESDWDCLVPVPLHPLKEREREFNQAERLASHLSAATGVPVESRALRRVENTRTQTRLSRSERAENMQGAFVVRPGARLQGRRVVVLDDVLTTGATTSACARALLEGGAKEVGVWTVARGLWR